MLLVAVVVTTFDSLCNICSSTLLKNVWVVVFVVVVVAVWW